MADFNSSAGVDSGLPQQIAGSRRLQRKKQTLFEGQSLVHMESRNGNKHLNKGLKRRSSVVSVGSEKSSNATRPSSITSTTCYRTSMDETPLNNAPRSPPRQQGKNENTDGFSPHTPVNNVEMNTVVTPSTSKMFHATGDQNTPVTDGSEPRRASSPRSHINSRQQQDSRQPLPLLLGPMERFLTQEDDLVEFNPAQMMEDRARLRTLRVDVLRLRAELRTKRKEVSEKELLRNAADQDFMKFIRKHMISSSSPSSTSHTLPVPELQEHFIAMQAARDEYGPSEDDYKKLEDFLDQKEFELDKLEGRLYRAPTSPGDDPAIDREAAPEHQHSTSLLGLSSEPKAYEPLHVEFLSRLGDLDLALERYQNVQQERQSLLSEQETRARFNIPFDEDKRTFLEKLPTQEAALKAEIVELQVDIEKLKAQCLEAGIDLTESADESTQESSCSEDGDINEDASTATPVLKDIQETRSEHNHSMFPLLFPPKPDESRSSLEDLNTEFDEGNKSDRINRWLLYRLRTSPLEIDLLVEVFLRFVNILDFHQWRTDICQWQENVMSFWAVDEANKPSESFEAGNTLNSSY